MMVRKRKRSYNMTVLYIVRWLAAAVAHCGSVIMFCVVFCVVLRRLGLL